MEIRWSKYFFVFILTASLFGTAFLLSSTLSERRLREVEAIERRITLNLLSSEVQFALLTGSSCTAGASPVLAGEINALSSRLEFMERDRGSDDPEVETLKAQYSLLQIKDLLLVRELANRCGEKFHTVVYFYSNARGACEDCERQGYVLSAVRRDYPDLKVYAFDYNLDLGAIDTLKQIYQVSGELPALVIDGQAVAGFQNQEAIEARLPGLEKATSSEAVVEETVE